MDTTSKWFIRGKFVFKIAIYTHFNVIEDVKTVFLGANYKTVAVNFSIT